MSNSSSVKRPLDRHFPLFDAVKSDDSDRNLITFSSSKTTRSSSSLVSVSSQDLDESDGCVDAINDIMPVIRKHSKVNSDDSQRLNQNKSRPPTPNVNPLTPPSSPSSRTLSTSSRNGLTNILNELKYKAELKSAIRDLLEQQFTISYEKVVSQADRCGHRELVDLAAKNYDKLKEQFVEYGYTFDTVEDLRSAMEISDQSNEQIVPDSAVASVATVTPTAAAVETKDSLKVNGENEPVYQADSGASQTLSNDSPPVVSPRQNNLSRPNVIRLNGNMRQIQNILPTADQQTVCQHRNLQ